MDALANAVVAAFAFLELSSGDVVNEDSAVKALSLLAAELQECTLNEKGALARAAERQMKKQVALGASEKVLRFYRDFTTNFWPSVGDT